MTRKMAKKPNGITKDFAVKVAGKEAALLALVDAKSGKKNPGEAALIIPNVKLTWLWSGNSPRYSLEGPDDAVEQTRGAIADGKTGLLAPANFESDPAEVSAAIADQTATL